MEYLDFDIEITLAAEGERNYQIKVSSPAGEAQSIMRFPFDEGELNVHLLRLQVALLRSGGVLRRVLSSEERDVMNFGSGLFDALVVGDVRSRYDQSRAKADQEKKGLRLRLHIHAPELASLPWEYMYNKNEGVYLSLSRISPIIRYLDLPRAKDPLTVSPPLRILGMVASPTDLNPLNVQEERDRMELALSNLKTLGLVELHWLEGQTWRKLQQAMRQGPWHIFHFIGHGTFDPQAQDGGIYLADEDGQSRLLSAGNLATLVADHKSLQLMVINACEGAKASEQDTFSSLGATLAQRGIPAILAMQHAITDTAAIEFTRTFYEALADGFPVEGAVTEARIAINVGNNNSLEWGTPVLFMRASDGLLFDLDEQFTAHREQAEASAQLVSNLPTAGTPQRTPAQDPGGDVSTSPTSQQRATTRSVAEATASVKKYIGDDNEMLLDELVSEETERVYAQLVETISTNNEPSGTTSNWLWRAESYEALIQVLVAMHIVGAAWSKPSQIGTWERSIARLANPPQDPPSFISGQPRFPLLEKFRSYPALLVFYGAGIAALSREKYEFLASLLLRPRGRYGDQRRPLAIALDPTMVATAGLIEELPVGRLIDIRFNEHLEQVLQQPLHTLLPDIGQYREVFDRFEYLRTLVQTDITRENGKNDPIHYGLYVARFEYRIWDVLGKEARDQGDSWKALKAGLFQGSLERFKQAEALRAAYEGEIRREFDRYRQK